MTRLDRKAALITGAARGTGRGGGFAAPKA